MADPLGFINQRSAGLHQFRQLPANGDDAARADTNSGPQAPAFKDVLLQNLNEVNQMQQDATKAVEDLQTGRRDDLEGVILATQKADTAFRMLQQLRNRMVEAYDEIKQVRV
jgi:flagellar hook-basal body complex protein FliE